MCRNMNVKLFLANAEEEILEFLWEKGEKMPAIEILNYFNIQCNKNWKKQTLNTFLVKLLQKGYIERISEDRRYLYSPIVTRKEYYQNKAESFIDIAYKGSFMNFVSALSGGTMISEEEADKIKALMKGH